MAFATAAMVLAFDIVLSLIEVPKMIGGKLWRELSVYSVLLLLGSAALILKTFGVRVPNPSDWVAWAYSPISKLLEQFW